MTGRGCLVRAGAKVLRGARNCVNDPYGPQPNQRARGRSFRKPTHPHSTPGGLREGEGRSKTPEPGAEPQGVGPAPRSAQPGRGYFAARAAAFASCLYARTFANDSGPVMSATERNDPASP